MHKMTAISKSIWVFKTILGLKKNKQKNKQTNKQTNKPKKK